MKLIILAAMIMTSSSLFAQNTKVQFLSPHNGEVVPTTFEVQFAVSDMEVRKAGDMNPNTGHHHLIIDGKSVPKGRVIPNNPTHKHFGDASTKTTLTLKPGLHTLTLQFADGAHKSYGEGYSSTITVDVKEK